MYRTLKKLQWPLVKKSTYKRDIKRHADRYNDLHRAGRKSIEDANANADRLVRDITRVKVGKNRDFNSYKIQVGLYIDSAMIDSMVHGNDQSYIRYICERLGHEVERELKTINFARIPIDQP